MMEGMRLNKYLAVQSLCSRREADRLIEKNRVKVNGLPARTGMLIFESDSVCVDGKEIGTDAKAEPVLIAYNKPCGVVCTSSKLDGERNIIEELGYGTRLFTIGRLDKDSHGLILLTNRGELVNLVNKAAGGHEKEYEVRCSKTVTDWFLRRMAEGVEIEVPERKKDRRGEPVYTRATTAKCKTVRIDEFTFGITITQGLNRQIRRMCQALGNRVLDLKRIRVMNISLGRLKEGTYRKVRGEELKEFENLLGL